MADKKTDFDELFGKKEPDRKPKEAPKSGFCPGGFSAEAERICRAQGE